MNGLGGILKNRAVQIASALVLGALGGGGAVSNGAVPAAAPATISQVRTDVAVVQAQLGDVLRRLDRIEDALEHER